MPSTARILRRATHILKHYKLHTGNQFATPDYSAVDIAAAVFFAAELHWPAEFTYDEAMSLEIIAASAPTMTAIRTLSDSLPTEPSYMEVVAGHEIPEYIEHVSNWAATTPVFGQHPPTTSEVIGALLRAARTTDLATVPAQRTAA